MLITKQDILKFPRFINHKTARKWLKERYGEYFCMADYGFDIRGKKIYYYHNVQDRARYVEWRDKLVKSEKVNDKDYEYTYQTCMITEDGKFNAIFK